MSEVRAYDPATIETRWQQQWDSERAFEVTDDVPRERCYYVLEMFPYPSGKLHMGHVRNYSIGDAVARYKRMRGFHVLHPMGWDSFGLPAEQAAIERGVHPRTWTYENIAYMRRQLKRMGFSYAWSREFACSDPTYARLEQELFLQLVEHGLVYRKSSMVNWSTGLNTVLANEQVINGLCWRTGMPVIQKELPQWFVRITQYAEELLAGTLELGQWPEAVLVQQRNWIGRSEGAEIDFGVEGHEDLSLTVFTTRADTLFGVTFLSMAPEHALLDRIVPATHRPQVQAFREQARGVSAHERMGEASAKLGVFTGAYAINPANGERVPIHLANFVLAGYGTGAVMAVPAHDDRDHDFALAYDIPIRVVIVPRDGVAPGDRAYTGPGVLTGSGSFTGQDSAEARTAIAIWLESRGKGRRTTSWRLRDWGISRQRYWGNPIPFVYGEESGVVPLRIQDLPVVLPDDVAFDGIGNPLERHPTWATTTAEGAALTVRTAHGREPARRETDTMDTFMESSWYFARFTCPDAKQPLDRTRVDHWLPVDLYIGGIEHAVLHLLYARFFQKALCDIGYSSVREPFKRLLCQGMVVMESYYREQNGPKRYFAPDEIDVQTDAKGKVLSATAKADGLPVVVGRVEKMSKTKRNGIDPQILVDRYGADTARLFILFAAPPERDLEWSEDGVAGAHRFIKRLWTLCLEQKDRLIPVAVYDGKVRSLQGADQLVLRLTHATVRHGTDAMEKDFAFNTTIAACMKLTNELKPDLVSPPVLKRALSVLLRLLAPMIPHVCAELWRELGFGNDIVTAPWPEYDPEEIAEDEIPYPIQVNGKIRGRITLPRSLVGTALEDVVRSHPEVQSLATGRTLSKVVVVQGKIINLVLS